MEYSVSWATGLKICYVTLQHKVELVQVNLHHLHLLLSPSRKESGQAGSMMWTHMKREKEAILKSERIWIPWVVTHIKQKVHRLYWDWISLILIFGSWPYNHICKGSSSVETFKDFMSNRYWYDWNNWKMKKKMRAKAHPFCANFDVMKRVCKQNLNLSWSPLYFILSL